MPQMLFFQVVPKVAIAPLFLVWFGVGSTPKVLVAFPYLVLPHRHRRRGRPALDVAFLSRLTPQDLTAQAGLALQQDLALASILGLAHVERNGHHYLTAWPGLPESEQAAFLEAHPDLYERSRGAVRVRITSGMLNIESLGCPGFASQAAPDWRTMRSV
jgi:hypothetical protein